jgi:ribonuclease P protein component
MNKVFPHDRRLPKKEIIRKRDDFRRLFHDGNKCRGKYLQFYYKKGNERRIGFTVPKRFGKAVARNRIKRWMREVYRKYRQETGDYWIVMMARPDAGPEKLKDIEGDFFRFLEELEHK